MKILPGLLFACCSLTVAQARPLVVQESARIGNPDPANYPYFASDVAIDGDDAIATLERYIEPPEGGDPADISHDVAVHLFHRTASGWTPVRQLVQHHHGPFASFNSGLAMRNGIAALALNPLYVFERRDGDWVSAPITGVDPDMPGDSISIDGSRILFGGTSGQWMGTLYEKDTTTGTWGPTSTMLGDYRGGDMEFTGGPVDISGGRVVVLSPYNEEEFPVASPGVSVFRDWGPPRRFLRQSDIRSSPSAPLEFEVAIRGDEIFIAGTNASGTRVYRPAPSDAWEEFDKLQPLDSHMGGGVTTVIEKNHLFLMQRNWNAERESYVINVFRKSTAGPYEHVATLVSSDGASLGNFGISSRRVIANCGNEACYFELPASFKQPEPIQQTFAGNSPLGFSVSEGSAFSIIRRGVSLVLHQGETQSSATHAAVLDASNWTNQSLQADIRPLAFAGGASWHGLATRYRDAGNCYFAKVTGSTVSLNRAVGGVLTTVATAPVTVTLNRPYRLRLESIGTRHRVYVNGVPVLDADDTVLTSGSAALLTHQAAAEFDNAVASPTPATILYAQDFTTSGGPTDLWSFTGVGLWNTVASGGNFVFAQSSVADAARAVIGVPTDDQSIDVRARPTTFAGTGNGDRWFGVMARYTDDANYYYLTLRNDNTASLRKLTNGAITVLGGSYSLPVTLGTWYRLRIEAVGTRIRGYVNGTLVAEATDSTHARGAAGPITNRAAVDFDDYRAIQP
jgi:hypothetical protein